MTAHPPTASRLPSNARGLDATDPPPRAPNRYSWLNEDPHRYGCGCLDKVETLLNELLTNTTNAST